MASINKDAVERMFVKMAGFRPPLPPFNVGDAVKVEYAQELAETDTVPVYGTVMAKYNAGLDDKFTIINVRGFPSLLIAPPLLHPRPLRAPPRRTRRTSGTRPRT